MLIWEACSVLSCTADHVPRAQGRRPEKGVPMLSEVTMLSFWALLSRGGFPAVLPSRADWFWAYREEGEVTWQLSSSTSRNLTSLHHAHILLIWLWHREWRKTD